MEPLTHLLTGAAISRTGLNRQSALATLTLVLAAEAPDIDVVNYFGGPVYGFAHHRGITHTFVGAPFVAALAVAVVYAIHRVRRLRGEAAQTALPPPRWGLLYGYALLAVLSHLLLDFTNAYGVRPFEPFSYRWYSWDIVSIVEPALYVILLAGLVLPALFGLINEEIASRRRLRRGRAGAIAALIGMVLVWGVRDYEHRRALAAMDSVMYQGSSAVRVGAYPYMLNPFRWYGVAETTNFFARVEVDSSTPEVDPQARALIRYKPEETPASLAAKQTYLGRVYLDWAMFPFTEVQQATTEQGGYTVRFFDLRYAYPELRRAPLSATVYLNQQLRVVAEHFGMRTQGQRELGDGSKGNQ